VLDLLHEQATYLGRSRVTARSKTWLVIGDSRTFGGGIARLLREVDATGSVRSAAAACHISYRHSWNLIRSAEQHLKAPLIQPRSGGLGGGNSVLTPQGRYWLALYARLDAAVTECTNREFAMIRDQGPLP
jgi:molybdate transport repressor ModE-like protein